MEDEAQILADKGYSILSFVVLGWAIIAVQTLNPTVLRKVAAGENG